MIQNEFVIGQIAAFATSTAPKPQPMGPLEVTRVLPVEDVSSRGYRIKSKAEPFERSVKEYEVIAVVRPPTELSATFARSGLPR